jgi:GNAT superfamily N-acetyltransferase
MERLLAPVEIVAAEREEVQRLRELFQREVNDIFLTERGFWWGWYEAHLIRCQGRAIGYGLVEVETDYRQLMEFYLLPVYRPDARAVQEQVLRQLSVTHMQTDTRREFQTLLFYDFCEQITAHDLFFRDRFSTHCEFPGLTFRRAANGDSAALFPVLHGPGGAPFEMESEEELREWISSGLRWLLLDGAAVVGVGALFEDFNRPFAEVGMMVSPPFRRRGYGTFILQELKKECYRIGLTPASRCAWDNEASRRSHDRSGFLLSGRQLLGVVKNGWRNDPGETRGV